MRFFAHSIWLLLLLLLAACADPGAPPEQSAVAYEVVAQEAPTVATETAPLTFAFRGEDLPAAATRLPDEALAALQAAQQAAPDALYLVVYGGQQPSGGYRVEPLSFAGEPGSALTFTYRVAGPGPDEGAAAVLTYPYLILRVDAAGTDPAAVRFAEEQS